MGARRRKIAGLSFPLSSPTVSLASLVVLVVVVVVVIVVSFERQPLLSLPLVSFSSTRSPEFSCSVYYRYAVSICHHLAWTADSFWWS
jgi:hypothetical protein